ncbi:MAG: cytochrome c-type biogenesis protein CcmF, partial [Flavobacteriales bacterium]
SLADHSFAPNTDYKQSYHIVQVPLAFLFIMLIGFVQWLKYKKTDMKKFVKKISRSLIIATVLMSVLLLFAEFKTSDFPVAALVFACIFAFTSNFDYLISIAKGKWDKSGASIAHIGFSLLILGAVISTSQSEIISQNQIGNIQDLNTDLNNREDMLLMQNDTLQMGDYFISYTDRHVDGIHHKFTVQYFENIPRAYKKDEIVYYGGMVFEAKDDHVASRNFLEQMADNWRRIDFPNERHAKEAIRWSSGTKGDSLFTLEPRIQLNEQMGNAPEPDTRHMLHKDVYTHLKWARLSEPETDEEGFLEGRAHDVHVGDSMIVSNILVTFDDIVALPDSEKALNNIFIDDIALQVRMTLKEKGEEKIINPLWIVRDSQIIPDMVDVDDWGMRVLINRFDPTTQTINLTIWEHESIRRDFIVMQAVVFPQINVLWIGCLIMILGTTLAVRHRIRLAKQSKKEE